MFRDVEDDLHRGWKEGGETTPWARVYPSVRAGFDRMLFLGAAPPAGSP